MHPEQCVCLVVPASAHLLKDEGLDQEIHVARREVLDQEPDLAPFFFVQPVAPLGINASLLD